MFVYFGPYSRSLWIGTIGLISLMRDVTTGLIRDLTRSCISYRSERSDCNTDQVLPPATELQMEYMVMMTLQISIHVPIPLLGLA
jgi:hypothetical protein